MCANIIDRVDQYMQKRINIQ